MSADVPDEGGARGADASRSSARVSPRRGSWPAALGMVIGGALAMSGVLSRPASTTRLPDGVVATVDGRPIRRADFERSLASLAENGRPLDARARAHVLDRLIDEELLVAYGESLGLAATEPRVRVELSRAVVEISNARAAERGEPTDAELRAHYAAQPARFGATERFRIERAFVATGADETAARTRAQALADAARGGAALASVDVPPVPLPDGPLAFMELRDLLGPSVAEAVRRLTPGAITPAMRGTGGYEVIRLVARSQEPPPFDAVRAEVRDDLLRVRADEALVRLLAERRAASRVVRSESP